MTFLVFFIEIFKLKNEAKTNTRIRFFGGAFPYIFKFI